ncbi:unnamed protein product [Calypogeia fissa]
MEISRFLGSLIWNPISHLVDRLLRLANGDAHEQSELHFLTALNNELYQQNETLTQDLFLLSKSEEILKVKFTGIQQELCSEREASGSYVDGSATPFLLEGTVKSLHVKVSCLAKLFVDFIHRSNGIDHAGSLLRHYNDIYLTRRAHVNFILKAWIYSVLFENFENESFLPGGATQFLDSNQRKLKSFESFRQIWSADSAFGCFTSEYGFAAFCHKKLLCFLALWQLPISIQVGNSRLFDLNGDFSLESLGALEPRTRKFIQGFLSVANIVWAIHKLCLSFEPCARIFRVERGSQFQEDYMNSVVSKEEDPKFVSEVGLMICPGFCLRNSVVKCEIYLHAA